MSTSVPQPPRSRFLGLRRHLRWRRGRGRPSTRFEELVEGLDAIVWEIDLVSRRMTFVSRRVERLTGYPLSELLGDVGGFAERIVHPDERGLVSAEHARAAATGEKVEYECRVLLADGSTPWMRVRVTAVVGPHGVVIGLRGVAHNVSQRRAAEHALREERERFRVLAEHAPVGIFETDHAGTLRFVNRRLAELIGLSADRVTGQSWLDAVLPVDRDRVVAQRARTVATGEEFISEYRIGRPGGGVAWVRSYCVAERDQDGVVVGHVGTVLDITAERRATHEREVMLAQVQEVAERSEEGRVLIDTLFAAAPVGLAFLDTELRCVKINDALRRLSGVSGEGTPGRTLTELQPVVGAHYEPAMRTVLDTGEPVVGLQTELENGTACTAGVYPVRGGDGKLVGVGLVVTDVTEQKRSGRAVRESEERLRMITDNLADVVFFYDMKRRLQYVTPSYEALTGYTVEQLHEQNFSGDVHAEDLPRMLTLWRRLWHGEGYSGAEFRIITRAGEVKWCWSAGSPVLDDSGTQVGVQIRDADVTARKRAEERLRASEERARSIVETTGDAFVATDSSGAVMEWNHAAELLFGWDRESVLSCPMVDLLLPEGQATRFEQAIELYRSTGDASAMLRDAEVTARRRDGSEFVAEMTLWAIGEADDASFNLFARDISERKRREEQVKHMAFHDTLTGLPNRLQFEQYLERALQRARRHELAVAVLYLDVDKFKQVNDTLGHDAGDDLLRGVAGRLREAARGDDLVVRLGGDEFLIVISDLPQASSRAISEAVARRVQTAFSRPFTLGRTDFRTTTSIGIGLYPDHGDEPALLMKAADAGMYTSKRNGRGTYTVADAHADAA